MSFNMMRGASGEADNQEVTHESGTGRLGNSFCAALCCSPVLILFSMGILGWNEKRAVCEAKTILAGQEVVEKVGCNSTNDFKGELIMFNCDLEQTGLAPLSFAGTDFSDVNFQGIGLSAESEMYLCTERSESKTQKDAVGGGKTTITTYHYEPKWTSSWVDSRSFRKRYSNEYYKNCGNADNPQWPTQVPKSTTIYQTTAKAGVWTLPKTLLTSIPNTAAVTPQQVPPGWNYQNDWYVNSNWVTGTPQSAIGQVRTRFRGTDWNNKAVTVLGTNNNGALETWVGPDSWLCSGFSLFELHMGTKDIKTLFKDMQASSRALTMILRVVFWLVMWFAFFLCFGPFEVVADCIPCIGPYIGDCVSTLSCCIACIPGTACALGVAGTVWVVMRPMVGIPLMILWFLTIGGLVGYLLMRKKPEKKDGGKPYEADPAAPPPQECVPALLMRKKAEQNDGGKPYEADPAKGSPPSPPASITQPGEEGAEREGEPEEEGGAGGVVDLTTEEQDDPDPTERRVKPPQEYVPGQPAGAAIHSE